MRHYAELKQMLEQDTSSSNEEVNAEPQNKVDTQFWSNRGRKKKKKGLAEQQKSEQCSQIGFSLERDKLSVKPPDWLEPDKISGGGMATNGRHNILLHNKRN